MGFFDIFQLAGLIFFLIVFLGRTLILWLRQGINPFALGAGKKGLPRLFELALFPWLVLWMLAVLFSAMRIPFRIIPLSWNPVVLDLLPLNLIGILMILFGDFVFVWALISLGNSWRVGIDERTAGALVTNGVFALSRNPIFVFLDLYLIGTFLIDGRLFFLIFAVVTALGIHYQILQEEKFLSTKYNRAYQTYRSRTGRYVSLVRRRPVAGLPKMNSKERKDWLRRFNRKVTNPLMMTFAGRKVYTVVDHVGRHSKKQYHTPVLGQLAGDAFFIPLPYGVDTDWCLNVLAAGGCVVHSNGGTYDLTSLQIVEAAIGAAVFPPVDRFLLRSAGVRKYLMAKRTPDGQP